MPKVDKPTTSKAAADTYRKPAKKAKPELSKEDKVRRLWRSVHDQLAGPRPFPSNALKNVRKILDLTPEDDFAHATKIQLLAGLDQYNDAVFALDKRSRDAHPLERAYSLYKLGKQEEALDFIQANKEAGEDVGDAQGRGLRLLEAQVHYRLEAYQTAHDIYEELLDTAEHDAPEYADLETNLAACRAHLDFVSSIPSRLSALSDSLPSVATLEATPLHALMASNASSKPLATRSNPRPPFSATSTQAKKKKKKPREKHARPTKLPAHIAALAPDQRPPPDPERWLPQSERSNWPARRAELEKQRERRRLEKKRNARQQTQGSAVEAPASAALTGGTRKGKGKK